MIHSIDGVFGGKDFYDDDGNYIGYSVDSVVGNGEDFYDAAGNYTGFSVDSVTGCGQDYYGTDGRNLHSADSILGGQSIWGDDGTTGFSIDAPFGGGEDIFLDSPDF